MSRNERAARSFKQNVQYITSLQRQLELQAVAPFKRLLAYFPLYKPIYKPFIKKDTRYSVFSFLSILLIAFCYNIEFGSFLINFNIFYTLNLKNKTSPS